ncbi:hypothetical protein [Salirhabdus sp. Marseille-P4669]|nr:hypothetical protein [Salirhabdus sp. Marseille-P4669]
MEEVVGSCQVCGKTVYCMDGFLDGVNEHGKLKCFNCAEDSDKKED